MATIAILGTGLLGSGFAEAALGRGETVRVWNRTAAKAQALAAHGARVAATPAEAVEGAERVHLVLSDDDAVETVIAQLRPTLGADTILVDHTTTQPARTADRCRWLASEGIRYLHCPVFISPAAARQAQGTILASGPRALFEAVEPALRQQAAKVVWLGERPDLAAVQKLCGNAIIVGFAGMLAEVFAIGKGAGVPAADTLAALDYFNPSAIAAMRGRKMAAGDFAASFELAMARKDVRLMLETSGDVPTPLLDAMAARMDALLDDGHGGDDVGVLARDAI